MRKSFAKATKKPDETIVYQEDGVLHRTGGPAVIRPDGIEEWYLHGRLHRDGGPAYRDPARTYLAWYQNGVIHRTDGPAIIAGADRYWMQNGLMHRTDGPALETADGVQFWARGVRFSSLAEIAAQARVQPLDANGVPAIMKPRKPRTVYSKPDLP